MNGIALLWNFTGTEGKMVQYRLERMLSRKDIIIFVVVFFKIDIITLELIPSVNTN